VSARTDAVVVGAGPNGLSAAIALARAGRSVTVLEAEDTPGGGCRSEELTLPGFVHDVCAAIHPLGAASPALAGLPLGEHGLEWVHLGGRWRPPPRALVWTPGPGGGWSAPWCATGTG
jgi:phytoene dehydrogenase-like protein